MVDDRLRYRLGLRASNAAVPHRNRAREAKSGQDNLWQDDWHDWHVGEENEDGDEERT